MAVTEARPPALLSHPLCRTVPHTSHPQDDFPSRLPGAIRNFAEQLFGVVLPGEGGGEGQVLADPTCVQLDPSRQSGDLGVVALPAQGDVARRADVGCGALQGGRLPLGLLLAGGSARVLEGVWGWRAEGGMSAWGEQAGGWQDRGASLPYPPETLSITSRAADHRSPLTISKRNL